MPFRMFPFAVAVSTPLRFVRDQIRWWLLDDALLRIVRQPSCGKKRCVLTRRGSRGGENATEARARHGSNSQNGYAPS